MRPNVFGSVCQSLTVPISIAGKHLKPVVLELGGKAPLIVLDDADLDAAVDATVFGAFANQGQICMSIERVIIDAKVADEFAARLVKRVRSLPVGHPEQSNVVLGSVIDRSAVERVQRMVADAICVHRGRHLQSVFREASGRH